MERVQFKFRVYEVTNFFLINLFADDCFTGSFILNTEEFTAFRDAIKHPAFTFVQGSPLKD